MEIAFNSSFPSHYDFLKISNHIIDNYMEKWCLGHDVKLIEENLNKIYYPEVIDNRTAIFYDPTREINNFKLSLDDVYYWRRVLSEK